jgi:hypothetical protein
MSETEILNNETETENQGVVLKVISAVGTTEFCSYIFGDREEQTAEEAGNAITRSEAMSLKG